MKIKKSPLKSKLPIIGVILVLLLVGGAYVYATSNSNTLRTDSSSQDKSTAANSPDGETEKVDTTSKSKTEEPKVLEKPATIPTNMTVSQEDSKVIVMTKIKNVTDGKCVLRISNGSATHTEKADIMFQPSYSTCAGFSIPVSELGSGKWSLRLTTTSEDSKGSASEGIEVK